MYRGTSLIRNRTHLGPYSRPLPGALWWSWGGGRFFCARDSCRAETPRNPENRAPHLLNLDDRLRGGVARAEDARGTPSQSHISPSILVYEETMAK